MNIPFTKTTIVGSEINYVTEAINANNGLTEDGKFSNLSKKKLSELTGSQNVVLTGSATQGLEIIALLLDLKPGDEVIMPAYTFVSAVNAFACHGATPVFVDINPLTMNIEESLIENAITPRTKAIMVMHYGGVSCNLNYVVELAKRHKLLLIEDAAQALSATFCDKALGSYGDFSVFSFHNTKNYSCGEGGALIINNPNFIERAQIIRDKGTNRSQFLAGRADKYFWVDIGCSYVLSELNAAFLYAHLGNISIINAHRNSIWTTYKKGLLALENQGIIETQFIPEECKHNAHIFYIKPKDTLIRTNLMSFLKEKGIQSTFHYSPLHTTAPGKVYGRFSGEDQYITKESGRILRLPLFYGLNQDEACFVVDSINKFFGN